MGYLVTGGAGFIGSYLVERLLDRGETVIALDNFNDYYDPGLKRRNVDRLNANNNGEFVMIEGDVRDTVRVNAVFDDHDITHVAHLAAMAGVRASVEQSPLYMAVNLTGTLNILEAARHHQTRQFVLASTSSVYGRTKTLPFVETDPADRPLASYPASKRAAELLAYTYHQLFGMQVVVLRLFNVYGPSGRPDMMPLRLMNAALDGTQMKIFNDGDIHRDWTYIDDTVDGWLKALDRPLGYEVINLGFGSPISLRDFIDIIEDLSGREINKESVPTPPSDPPITYCDNTKARELLDFDPQVSVQEGLRRTWEWFREVKGL